MYKISDQYNSIIRDKYLALHFPHNAALFMLSLTGFIWNPAVISLNDKDTVQTIFKKAGKNIVTLLDDATEMNMLLKLTTDKNPP